MTDVIGSEQQMHKDDMQSQQGREGFRMLRESELAERWSLSRRTLQRWRSEGDGPPFHLIGGTVRYHLDDILAFEDKTRIRGEGT